MTEPSADDAPWTSTRCPVRNPTRWNWFSATAPDRATATAWVGETPSGTLKTLATGTVVYWA